MKKISLLFFLAISFAVWPQEQNKPLLQRIKELEEQNQKLMQENLELKRQMLEQMEKKILSERLSLLQEKVEQLQKKVVVFQKEANDHITTNQSQWSDMPGMTMSITLKHESFVLILFKTGGVQACSGPEFTQPVFRLMVDDTQKAYTLHEFHRSNIGPVYELRDVSLNWAGILQAGEHTIKVQWAIPNGVLHASWYGDNRTIIVVGF